MGGKPMDWNQPLAPQKNAINHKLDTEIRPMQTKFNEWTTWERDTKPIWVQKDQAAEGLQASLQAKALLPAVSSHARSGSTNPGVAGPAHDA